MRSSSTSRSTRADARALGRAARAPNANRRNPRRGNIATPRRATPADALDKKRMSDEEYVALKRELSSTTLAHGAALSAYCLLGYGVAPGLSAALGSAGGCARVTTARTTTRRFASTISDPPPNFLRTERLAK